MTIISTCILILLQWTFTIEYGHVRHTEKARTKHIVCTSRLKPSHNGYQLLRDFLTANEPASRPRETIISASHAVILAVSPVLGLSDAVSLSVFAGFLSVSVPVGFLSVSVAGFCVSFSLMVTVIAFVTEAP